MIESSLKPLAEALAVICDELTPEQARRAVDKLAQLDAESDATRAFFDAQAMLLRQLADFHDSIAPRPARQRVMSDDSLG